MFRPYARRLVQVPYAEVGIANLARESSDQRWLGINMRIDAQGGFLNLPAILINQTSLQHFPNSSIRSFDLRNACASIIQAVISVNVQLESTLKRV